MKIDSIELKNFRGISDLAIEFDKRATVIYGINGMGKSAILDACNILFSRILSEAAMDNQIGNRMIAEKDVKVGETETEVMGLISDEGETYLYYRKRIDGQNTHRSYLLQQIAQKIQNFSLFFEWFRGRQEYENSIKIEESTFVDKQLEAARKAILKTLGEQFSTIRIKITEDEAELVLEKNGCELNVKQLSEGEKSIVALVGDIARRLAIANPGAEDILSGEGIVLIDEIDLHLHPSWQAIILPILLDTFQKLQFIVTTHSSKVLGETGENVKIVKLDTQKDKVETFVIPPLNGWDVNTILEEYMGTSSINLDTKAKINKMFELIDEEEFDEAEKLADEIEQMTDSENLSVVRARVLIARGR